MKRTTKEYIAKRDGTFATVEVSSSSSDETTGSGSYGAISPNVNNPI